MYCPRVMPRHPATAAALAALSLLAALPAAQAQMPLAQLAATTMPAAGAPAASPLPEYRLGAGDVLRITVYQSPDLSFETRVADNGSLSYPLIGPLPARGLTVGQVERLIADGLKKGEYLKEPQVSVVLLEVRGNVVSVLGQVAKAGRYPLEQSNTRLSDVLAQAGGVTPLTGSDIVTIVGTREGKPWRLEVDLPLIFAPGSAEADLPLQHNDVVWVGRAPQFFIYGEVQRAGAYRLERGMTLMQGLATGGGLTLRGTEKGIRVHRKSAGAAKTEVLQPGMDDALRDGDVIYVRESLF